MQKISPFLWFDGTAEEAARFYTSTFKNSKLGAITRFPAGMPDAGKAMTVEFEIEGTQFTALNGGPMYKFTEAVSFSIDCKSQDEVDYFWDKLGEGGVYQQCGWLKDRFGLSWQVVPDALPRLLKSSGPAAAGRVAQALMGMNKIDIAALEAAARV